MRTAYFSQDKPDDDDIMLKMAIGQGYVPGACLLGGMVVMSEVNGGRDPCAGCHCPETNATDGPIGETQDE